MMSMDSLMLMIDDELLVMLGVKPPESLTNRKELPPKINAPAVFVNVMDVRTNGDAIFWIGPSLLMPPNTMEVF